MEKRSPNDIAAFPELFDGMEQFISEQIAGLRRAGTTLIFATSLSGGMVAWWLNRAL